MNNESALAHGLVHWPHLSADNRCASTGLDETRAHGPTLSPRARLRSDLLGAPGGVVPELRPPGPSRRPPPAPGCTISAAGAAVNLSAPHNNAYLTTTAYLPTRLPSPPQPDPPEARQIRFHGTSGLLWNLGCALWVGDKRPRETEFVINGSSVMYIAWSLDDVENDAFFVSFSCPRPKFCGM